MNRFIQLLILLSVTSCISQAGHNKLLDQVERVVDTHADSAYRLLVPVNLKDIRGEANQARFALLYAKTLDKRRICVDNDSLVSVSLDFYKNHGSDFEKASAYLYSARVDYYANDISEAVKKLTYAKKLVHKDSLYLKGLITGTMGLCYSAQFDHVNAIENYKEEYEVFCKLDIMHNQASSLYNQSKEYALLKNYSNAIKLCLSSQVLYDELKDTINVLKCGVEIAKWRVRDNEKISTVRQSYFKMRKRYEDYPLGDDEYSLLAELYGRDNVIDSAKYYLRLAINCTDTTTLNEKVTYHSRTARLVASERRYREAYMQLRSANTYAEKFYCESLDKSTKKMTEKYKGEIYKERSRKLKTEKDNITIISFTTLLLLLLLIYTLISYYKKRLRKLDDDLGIAQDLAQAITSSQNVLEGVQKTMHNAISETESLDRINFMMVKLNSLIEKMPRYETQPRNFIDAFIKIMRSECKAKEGKTLFYNIIDRHYCGVLDKLKTKYKLDQNEIEIVCMLALGVSNNAIRIILNHTNNRTIYNYRSSVKLKLNTSIDSNSILNLLNSEKHK